RPGAHRRNHESITFCSCSSRGTERTFGHETKASCARGAIELRGGDNDALPWARARKPRDPTLVSKGRAARSGAVHGRLHGPSARTRAHGVDRRPALADRHALARPEHREDLLVELLRRRAELRAVPDALLSNAVQELDTRDGLALRGEPRRLR